jgi:hypothetical protein
MSNSPAFFIRFLFFKIDEVGPVSASTCGHGRLCSPGTSFEKGGRKKNEEEERKKGRESRRLGTFK